MADTIKSDGAKPAQNETENRWSLTRRDQFARAFGAAMLTRSQRTPHSLAREVVDFTDAFLAALDKGVK